LEDFNSDIEFDSEILARSNIDFNTNKQKFSKNKKVIIDNINTRNLLLISNIYINSFFSIY